MATLWTRWSWRSSSLLTAWVVEWRGVDGIDSRWALVDELSPCTRRPAACAPPAARAAPARLQLDASTTAGFLAMAWGSMRGSPQET